MLEAVDRTRRSPSKEGQMFWGKLTAITAVVVLSALLAVPAFAGGRPDNRSGPHGIGTVATAPAPDAFARAVSRHTLQSSAVAAVRPNDRAGRLGIGSEAVSTETASSSGGSSSWPTIGIVAAAVLAGCLSLGAAGAAARRRLAHS
jgi:hypothetical protein